MELNLSERVGSLLQALFLLILPWVVLLIGLAVSLDNVWYYLLCITWFGCGLVFFGTLN
ncbi:MAG: hypothetical protein IMZ43_03855 [Thermoplasmata archaeon]|jgi:hypothetical protein|nr:hypothetical protein [Thermoplasmata archaeon]MBE3136514.1 hypothetical protein [Thermoplasmata archaeon]